MSIYITSDIHGNAGLFFKMLKEIAFSKDDELYIIGDILDRGNGSWKIYDYIMKQDNIHLILGNHEVALLNVNHAIETENWQQLKMWKNYWFEGDGQKTYEEFFGEWTKEKRQKYIDYFNNCHIEQMIKIGRKYHYLVHACVSNDMFEKVADRRIMFELANGEYDTIFLLLDNGLYKNTVGYFNATEIKELKKQGYIVNPTIWFGHTPTQHINGGDNVWIKNNFRDIDCGCKGYKRNAKLCCVRLNDEKIFYIG